MATIKIKPINASISNTLLNRGMLTKFNTKRLNPVAVCKNSVLRKTENSNFRMAEKFDSLTIILLEI